MSESWVVSGPGFVIGFETDEEELKTPYRAVSITEIPPEYKKFRGRPLLALLGHLAHKKGAFHARRL